MLPPPAAAPYSFDDPDSTGTGQKDTDLTDLIIAEHDASDNIVNDNQTNYPVTLSLAALSNFAASHITSASSELTAALNNNAIAISATNACSIPPCTNAETTALGTLTINEVADTFSIVSVLGTAILLNNNIATITVPDQAGATSLSSADLGSITIKRTGDDVSQTYSISAAYASTPVTDIISKLGGIRALLSASLAGISTSHNSADPDNSPFFLAGQTITVTGLTNAPDSSPLETGSITINTDNLPAGFYAHPNLYEFTDPPDTNEQTLSFDNAFYIAEGDAAASPPSITENNKLSYNLSIPLTALPPFILDAASLELSITTTISGSSAVSIANTSLSTANDNAIVTITATAGAINFNSDKLSSSSLTSGSLTLTNTADADFSIVSEVQKTFTDPAGTEFFSSNLGTFSFTTKTAPIQTISYGLMLHFAPSYNLLTELGDVIAELETSSSNPYTLPQCIGVVPFSITEDGTSNFALTDTTVSTYYYDDTTPENNTNTPTITDAAGTSRDFFATIIYQECTADTDNFAGGRGTAADPWQINNDIQLDIMSRLINDAATYSAYQNDYYTLTADINMGISSAPWAKDSSAPNAKPNGFTPIGKSTNTTSSSLSQQNNRFSGQLDCEHNSTKYTISNLYINNTASTYIGLFGVIANGAVMTNCTLADANITGYNHTGGLAGAVITSGGGSTTVSGNTITTSSITASFNYAGGLAGAVITSEGGSTTVSGNTITTSSITANTHYAGGLAGAVMTSGGGSTTVSDNTITTSSITANSNYAGGLAGGVDASTNSSNTFSNNTITDNSSTASLNYTGGLAGYIQSYSSSTNILTNNTITTSSITANSNHAGGIAGYVFIEKTSSNAFNNNIITDGSITANSHHAGGIAGSIQSYSSSTNVFNNNIITDGSSITANSHHAGGIAGYVQSYSSSTSTFTNNTITNSSITANSNYAGGLAGYVQSYSGSTNTFTNNTITTSSITANTHYAGGLAGYVLNQTKSTSTLTNNTITNNSITANTNYAGGLTGYVQNQTESTSTFTNNTITTSSITANSNHAGGLAGYVLNQTESTSTHNNNIITASSITANSNYAGGLAGYIQNQTNNTNTHNNNTITNSSIKASFYYAGGLAGYIQNQSDSTSTFNSNTVANSDITASYTYAGGIIAYLSTEPNSTTTINMNAVTGGRVFGNYDLAGGIVGTAVVGTAVDQTDATITINFAFVSTLVRTRYDVGVSGGIIGNNTSADIANSFFAGRLRASKVSGGITAVVNSSPSISNSYALIELGTSPDTLYGVAPLDGAVVHNSYFDNTIRTGATDSAAHGQTTSALQTPTDATGIYADWDAAVWNFGTSSQYPMLKNLPITEAEQCAAINTRLSLNLNCTY